MIDRIVRAIQLDRPFYRAAALNPALMTEAAILVVIVALLSATPGLLFASDQHGLLTYGMNITREIVLGWLLWAVISYFVGTALFQGRGTLNGMLRTLGYASAPRLLGLLGFIPCIGWVFALVGWVLSLVAGIVAIRETMEFDTGNAVVTALVGFVLYLIAGAALSFMIFTPAAILFH